MNWALFKNRAHYWNNGNAFFLSIKAVEYLKMDFTNKGVEWRAECKTKVQKSKTKLASEVYILKISMVCVVGVILMFASRKIVTNFFAGRTNIELL